jgi:hypothetical protein
MHRVRERLHEHGQRVELHGVVDMRYRHVREHRRHGVERSAMYGVVELRGRHLREHCRLGVKRSAVHGMRRRAVFGRHERIDVPCVVDVCGR